jgi:hypothetical protein
VTFRLDFISFVQMNDKNNSDATPTRRTGNIYKIITMIHHLPQRMFKLVCLRKQVATKPTVLLRAMTDDADSDSNAGGAIKVSNDKLVSLTAQSPAQAIIEDIAFLAELHNDDEGLSLIQLCHWPVI